MAKTTDFRIGEALMLIVYKDKNRVWRRVSRQHFDRFVNYWQNQNNFHYAKIYDIIDFKKGGNHQLGAQIGYITLKGSKLSASGVFESSKSIDYSNRLRSK